MSAAAGWWLLAVAGYKEVDIATVIAMHANDPAIFVCLLALGCRLEGAGLGRSEDTNEDEGFEKALLEPFLSHWGDEG